MDRDDPILDACLDEVLGGRTAPDLTARILAAMAAREASLHGGSLGTSIDAEPAPPPIAAANGQPLVALRMPLDDAPKRRSAWQPWLVAAGVAGIGLAVGAASVVLSNRYQFATRPTPSQPVERGVAQSPTAVTPSASAPDASPQVVHSDRPAPADINVLPRPERPQQPTPPQIAKSDAPATPPQSPAPAIPPAPERRYLDPSPHGEVVSFVNAELNRSWTEAGVKPAPAATDAEWCRRLFVRVLGRIPTRDELEQFTRDRSADKREKLVSRLLNEDNYVEEYARHWSVIWSNVLVGRTGGRGNSAASREGLEHYLRQSLAQNKPYDQLVHELLTATGGADPDAPDYNPAVNFLLDGLEKDATVATSRVARVMLGTQLQCAQCHTHPSQDWQQEQFWALNAFFRQLKVERDGGHVKLVRSSFPAPEQGSLGQGSPDGGVFYETPSGLLKTAFPKFLDGTEIAPSGDLAAVDRRAELARLIVQSERLPKAAVNRLWSHFFGYGFTRPVDDLSSPSHPELLDRLAREFEAHDYDLKSAIRWIALSDPFARSSRMSDLASKDMPEAGEVALFSRYYSRQMQAEEVYNSLAQAAQIRKTSANAAAIEKARVDWLAQFSRNMATDDAQEESHFAGGVRQSLILMNGDLMRQAVSAEQAGLLKSLVGSDMKFDQKVEHLFLTTLSRTPLRREQAAAANILRASGGSEATALEDILWAILNSNEFILDH